MLAYQFMQRILVISLLATVIACSESSTPDKIQSRSNDSSYDYSILEGDSGSKPISISYDSGTSESIIYETFNITAAEKSDYESVSEELHVRKGASYTIDLTIYSDEEIEGTETFGIRFKSNDGNVLEEKTIQILNDDFPTLSVNKPEVAEADVGTSRLRFQFVLEDPVVDDYKVLVSSMSVDDVDSEVLDRFPNIATPDIDYESVEQEFTFTSNTDVHELNINVLSEDIVENDEYVLLEVQNIEGPNVLTEQYAIGVIRTDETPKKNGFEIALADADADRILITEGPLQADQKDSWQPYRVDFKVDKPENIIEDQNISVRLLSEADYKELVTNDNYDYVDTGLGQFDLCLSLPNTLPSNTEECEIQQWTTLEPDQATLSYDIYVNQDLVRENSEDFVLLLENDQGVEFAAIFGQILNDDQEELTLIRPDTQETVYLKDLASDIELFEPKENEQTYRFEFALDSEISNTYEVEYEVVSFLPRSPASLNEFSDVSGTLEFNPNTESLYIDITLYADKTYDGDKYIQIRFKEDGLKDIVIKIVDVDLPEIVVRSTDDIKTDDGGRYILHEQAEKSYGRDVVVQESALYSFELTFLGTTTALTDRTYNIERMFNTVDPSEYDSSECQANQIYRDSNQLGFSNASGDDVTLIAYEHYEEDGQQKLRQLTNPTEITIKRNTSSVSFAIEVQNDTDIECLEHFSVRFSPKDEPNKTEDSIALVNFSISNRDAAIIEVQGFTVDEPETGEIQANLTLTSSHPIELPLGLTLSPSVDNTCNTDSNVDIEFSPNQSTSFVSSLQQEYPVFIKADELVELDEECHLSASLVTNESLNPAFETRIQHQCMNNGVACSEQNLDYVASKINNTDELDVTVSLVNTKMNESGNVIDQETGEKTLKFARFAWNKAIASNVPEGTIALNAVLNTQSCSADYCADGDDFNDSPRVNLTSASNMSTSLLTEIQDDDQFEKTEYASFDVSVESGSEYVKSFPSNFAIEILENDPVTITVEKENDCDRSDSDADFNEERECKIAYSFRSTGDASSDISLDINALFETDLTLNSEQYEDAAVYFYDPATEPSKDKIDLGSNQSVQLDIMDGGSVTSKQLIIEFHSDDVVELDETFNLSFSKGQGTDYNLDLTNVSGESYVFNNDDLLDIEVIGERQIDEPAELTAPFSIVWDKAVDIPSGENSVVLSYTALPDSCEATEREACLSPEDIQYTTENNTLVLTHELTINGAASLLALDQYSVKAADGLIELPETLTLQITTESQFVSSIVHTNGTEIESDDLNGQISSEEEDRIELPWTLTVNSEEQLELIVRQEASSLAEACVQVNGQCPEQNLITLEAKGAIASNGPDLTLNVNDTCTSNAPTSGCLSIIDDPALFPAGADIAIEASSRSIVLEKSGSIENTFQSHVVSAFVNDDEIVEIPESMTLSLAVDSSYLQFIETGSSATWQQARSFTVSSDDVSDVTVEMSGSNTCISNGVASEGTNASTDCTISYVLEANKEIASDVPDLAVSLKRGANFNERLVVRSLEQQDDLHDVAIAYRNQSIEESEGSDDQTPNDNEIVLPIHNTGSVTAAGQTSKLVFVINSDSIVEEDERIEYVFDSSNGSEYFTYPDNFKYDFSIKNDDFIDLIVLGQTTQSEPDSGPINPFSLQWSGEIDLPASELPVLTLSHDSCAGDAALECLSIGNDVNIDASKNTIELNNNTKPVDYISLKTRDNLVELPEKIDLNLSSPSPYVQSIAVINQESAQNDDAQDNLTFFKDEASGIVSANWPLTVLSDDKLILTPSYTSFSVSEGCAENQSTCTKSLGELQVAGNIAENGPSIELDIALSCDSLDECASLWVNDSTPFDVQEGTDFGTTNLHTYNQTPSLPASISLDVNIHDDELVEPIESFNVVYQVTDGSDYIDSSGMATQAFNIPVQDVAELILEKSLETSCSDGETDNGKTIYPEPDDTCDSVYSLKLSKSIADNVSSINASIVRDTTLLHPLSVKSSATEVGFDVAILSDASEQFSDSFIAPLHNSGSPTQAYTELAKVTLRHKDDDELEVRESLRLDISSSNSSLVLVNGDNSFIHESIDSNEHVLFLLEENTDTVSESSSESFIFTITSNSAIEKLETDIVLTLEESASNSAKREGTPESDDYQITLAADSKFTLEGNTFTLPTSEKAFDKLSETVTITVTDDKLVEVDETIALELVIASSNVDTAAVAKIDPEKYRLRAMIESDDRAFVTFYPSGDYNEGNIAGSTTEPIAYSLSNSIDSNVPTIYLDIEDMCDQISSADVNCVEFVADVNSSDDSGDVVKPTRLQIHTAGVETEKTNIDQFPQGVAISNLYSRVDNTIEHHETLHLKFKVPVDSDTGGRMYSDYLSHLQNYRGQLPLNLDSEPESKIVILNDDKVNLTISEVVDKSNDSCWNTKDADKKVLHEGLEGSSTCIFNISIDDSSSSVVADDVDPIQLAMSVDAGVRLNESLNPSDQVIDPADIQLRQLIQDAENRSDGILDLMSSSNNLIDSQLELKIIDDDFVENDENLHITIPLVVNGKDHEFVRSIDYDDSMIRYWSGVFLLDYRKKFPLNSNFKVISDDTATVSIEMISHEDDQENITEGAIIEGNESNVSKLNYKISVDKGFAPDYPMVTASLTKTDSSSETTQDYSIDSTSLTLNESVDGTPKGTKHEVTVNLVKDDGLFEENETVLYSLLVDQEQNIDATHNEISYLIKDDDDLIITFTNPIQSIGEGSSENELTAVTLNYNASNIIAHDVPSISLVPMETSANEIEVDSTVKTNDIASGYEAIALHRSDNDGKNTDKTGNQGYTIEYVQDDIVEPNETHDFYFQVSLDSSNYPNLSSRISLDYMGNTSDQNSNSITLINDDFINLQVVCSSSCDQIPEGDSADDSGQINLIVKADYSIEDIDLSSQSNKVKVDMSSGASDEELATSIAIDKQNKNELMLVMDVDGDKDIEKDDAFGLTFTLPESKFVEFAGGETSLTQSIRIKNDDYFSVTDNLDNPIVEGGHYALKVCIPNGYSLPDNSEVQLTSTLNSLGIESSKTSQPLKCEDVLGLGNQNEQCLTMYSETGQLTSTTFSKADFINGCYEMSIFSSEDGDSNYSKWVKLELSSNSDERFQNFDQNIDLLVVNNDLTNMVDTGLTDCLVSNADPSQSCTGQDAAETQDDSQAYPDLKFTYVSNVGDPILQANNTSCLQDNATGFIWSKPISDGQEYAVVRDQLQSISDLKANYGCGFQDDSTLSWQHPTIEDLMTLLDLSLLGQSHPAQIQYLEETNWTANPSGSPITHARYWSSTSCGGANYLTLDFSTGMVACTHKNTESAQLIIYK